MREAEATKAISLIVAINVCPTGAREGRGGGCYRTTCICYCYGYITHTPCCLWLASITARQSTVQRSTTRTSIFHPYTINIPRCCSAAAVAVFRVPYFALSTVLLFRLCCSVLNTLHICCASSGANAFAWQKAKHFFKHFSFAFHVQLFQFSHRKCFDKYAQLEF